METIHQKNDLDLNKFNNYTLFIVRACQGNIWFFLTKKDNRVYGKHLKELIKRGVAMNILFLQSAFIHSQSEI